MQLLRAIYRNYNFRLPTQLALAVRCASQVHNIDKILIANRGEIACRVIRTAKKLGIRTVAVFSDADKSSLHVKLADEAYHIGPPPSDKSYLQQRKILDVAKESSAKAIHPGYGFLSENSEFADLCEAEGVIFIGPPSSAIRDMGIKSTSKHIMHGAGVPIIEGYHGEDQSEERLAEEAKRIGFPVMIKAVRGGGGKGMRIAMSLDEFKSQLESARLEAQKAVGDDVMLVEKFVQRPRHVEVQVFGDKLGNYVYLFERDCSVQRRHQKIVEEAPAPGISDGTRRSIGEAAVKAAHAVNYVGAGTVEFIMNPQQEFFFMEMNTRLQVEHPVSEMITDTDLVEWQIRVAAGEPLPKNQDQLRINGHAFEARIYAEDPDAQFMPGAGTLKFMATPPVTEGVRVETGVRQGDEVSVFYDPMIAKLVVGGPDRASALRRLRDSLAHYHIAGLTTNIPFLSRLIRHPSFEAGDVHTDFIPQHQASLFPHQPLPFKLLCKAALALLLKQQKDSSTTAQLSQDHNSPFRLAPRRRFNHLMKEVVSFREGEDDFELDVSCHRADSFTISSKNEELDVNGYMEEIAPNHHQLTCFVDGVKTTASVLADGESFHIFSEDSAHEMVLPTPKFVSEQQNLAAAKGPVAPMPGTVEKVFVNVGDEVKAGDSLVVMIAMKMEYVIKAPGASRVKAINFQPGVTVGKGVALVDLEEL